MPDNWQYPIWNEGVYDPDFGKEFVPTDGINKSLKKILPYQDTQVPPCLLSPKYREGS